MCSSISERREDVSSRGRVSDVKDARIVGAEVPRRGPGSYETVEGVLNAVLQWALSLDNESLNSIESETEDEENPPSFPYDFIRE